MKKSIVSNSIPSGNSNNAPILPSDGNFTAYTFLRHTGFILDELSALGLIFWLDQENRWQWRWQGTELKSSRGFWAIGEALVDAVIGRFPETFSSPNESV